MPLSSEQRQQIRDQVFYRDATLISVPDETRAEDDDERVVHAVFSTNTPVKRWWGNEILEHSAEAIDLKRAANGGVPMHFNHDRNVFLGKGRDLAIGDGRLEGDLHFSKTNAHANEYWPDVRDGLLTDVSIGYHVLEWVERADSDDVAVTRWELVEISVVTMPADVNANIQRDEPQPADTGDDTRAHSMPAPTTGDDNKVANFQDAHRIGRQEGEQAGVERERARLGEIRNLFTLPAYQGDEYAAIRATAENEGWSIERTQRELVQLVGNNNVGPVGGTGGFTQSDEFQGRIQVGEEAGEKFERGVKLALAVKAGIEDDKEKVREAQSGEYLGMSFPEIARDYLRINGGDTRGLNNPLVTVVRAMQHRSAIGQGTGSLTAITENIANMAVLKGYDEAEETWRMIASVNSTPDFKQFSRVGISSFEDLDIVDENGEYKLGIFGDRAEKGQIVKFGKRWGISMEALANDEMGVLMTAGRKIGRAGQRAVGNSVYDVLNNNPTLNQDATALFHASHNNIMNDAGLPTVDRLDEMMVAMATQTDQSGAAVGLNIELERVVTPVSMKTRSKVLQTSQYDPDSSAQRDPNPFQNTFIAVADARLTGTNWYGMADPNKHDTIEVTFLNGQDEPLVLSKEGWTVDGIELKVMMPCVAIPLDFRTMCRNPGQ